MKKVAAGKIGAAVRTHNLKQRLMSDIEVIKQIVKEEVAIVERVNL